MTTTWTETAAGEWISDARAYGADEKGRTVGGFAAISQTDSLSYEVRIFATRNGKRFGALPRRSYFATLSEAQAAAEPKLAAQAKRYAKKVAA